MGLLFESLLPIVAFAKGPRGLDEPPGEGPSGRAPDRPLTNAATMPVRDRNGSVESERQPEKTPCPVISE